MSDSFRPHGLEPTRLLCPWGFSKQEYWSRLPWPPLGDLPNLGIKSRSPALQIDSLPSEPLGKPKNTGLVSLSLLQWLFPTQESNWGLLHCRHIIYQLSYEGSPILFSVQSLSHVLLFSTPWTAACLASLSMNNSWSLLKLMSIESVMPSNNLISFL